MLVSIVIPTYKRPALLIKCLRALIHQDFPESQYEVIVVTDGPDHGSLNFLEVWGQWHRCRTFSLLKKKGPAAARNLGWRMAKGELILFTDDDCIPGPQWIGNYWDAYQDCRRDEKKWHFPPCHVFRGPVTV